MEPAYNRASSIRHRNKYVGSVFWKVKKKFFFSPVLRIPELFFVMAENEEGTNFGKKGKEYCGERHDDTR